MVQKTAGGSTLAGSIPAEEPAPTPETDEERQRRIKALESGPERLEIPLYGLLEERVSPTPAHLLIRLCTLLIRFVVGQISSVDILDSIVSELRALDASSSTPASLFRRYNRYQEDQDGACRPENTTVRLPSFSDRT